MTDKTDAQPMPEAGEVRYHRVAQYVEFRPVENESIEISFITDTGLRFELDFDSTTFCELARAIRIENDQYASKP